VNERLDRITTRAKDEAAAKFNNVFTLLNQELLFYAFRRLKQDKAPGVDGVTVEDYEANLQANLQSLLNGVQYAAIVACVEDKIVQRATVMILERIYEVDFCDTSYGYRPGRSCHEALADLGQIITRQRVNFDDVGLCM
jgi:RNA-directed DNA polymerase